MEMIWDALSAHKWWAGIAVAVVVAFNLFSVFNALLKKENSRATLGWIAFILYFPLGGAITYWLFGVNRVKTASERQKREVQNYFKQLEGTFPKEAPKDGSGMAEAKEHLPEYQQEMLRAGFNLTNTAVSPNNNVKPLYNGEEAYPRMLAAIRSAKASVYLTTYIFETNDVGREFIDALVQATKRGVDVRVILDGVGEFYSFPRAGKLLLKNGVPTVRYLPPRLFPPQLSINLRNHRKVLVVDAHVAFTGGMNIGGRHMVEDPDNPHPVQDLHFMLCGPVVIDLAHMFFYDWVYANRHGIRRKRLKTAQQDTSLLPQHPSMKLLTTERPVRRKRTGPRVQRKAVDADVSQHLVIPSQPNITARGRVPYMSPEAYAAELAEFESADDAWCRLIPDGPDENLWRLETLLSSVSSLARKRIIVMSPYFLPTGSIESALLSAALRGVDVTVVIPEESNQPQVHMAMYRMLPWMLENNVKVVMQKPPFAHTKVVIIDDYYVLLGSANMDPRSLRLNFELGVEVIDPLLVQNLMDRYQEVIENAKPLTKEDLEKRSYIKRVADSICWLFSPYL